MIAGRTSIKITEAEIAEIDKALRTLHKVLGSHLLGITNKEKNALPKARIGRMSFLEKSATYAREAPEFLPAFVDPDEFKIDMKAAHYLIGWLADISNLHRQINDTTIVALSEAYVASLAYYKSVTEANRRGVKGALTIYEDLKQAYGGRGKRKVAGEDGKTS